jgi:hypothetical protein
VFRQTNLRTLKLVYVQINAFEWSELNFLKKLTLKSVTFARKEAFENFTRFMKSLDKVAELKLCICHNPTAKELITNQQALLRFFPNILNNFISKSSAALSPSMAPSHRIL